MGMWAGWESSWFLLQICWSEASHTAALEDLPKQMELGLW